jgi:hypothetical protein
MRISIKFGNFKSFGRSVYTESQCDYGEKKDMFNPLKPKPRERWEG